MDNVCNQLGHNVFKYWSIVADNGRYGVLCGLSADCHGRKAAGPVQDRTYRILPAHEALDSGHERQRPVKLCQGTCRAT
jgi:hypothetical protein